MSADLTLRCPVCDRRADVCFEHGDDWKKRPDDPTIAQLLYKATDAELKARVDAFCDEDDEREHVTDGDCWCEPLIVRIPPAPARTGTDRNAALAADPTVGLSESAPDGGAEA